VQPQGDIKIAQPLVESLAESVQAKLMTETFRFE